MEYKGNGKGKGSVMKLLEQRIREQGQVRPGNVLKVDCFLNHQLDVELLDAIGAEFRRIFDGAGVNKILTIEASGIAIACMTARHFGVPVVFAKKAKILTGTCSPPPSTPLPMGAIMTSRCPKSSPARATAC